MEMVAAITRWLNCDNGGCAAIMGAVMIRTKESAAAFANDTEYGEELLRPSSKELWLAKSDSRVCKMGKWLKKVDVDGVGTAGMTSSS
ncbi:hypothetical protein C5167_027782 [Papaver somniferum]|nr:hypothetical protein C5167_027782 [Papaver somniferum]